MLDFLFGVAHGLIFSVFAVSGVGKLVGCQRGSRIMCQKAILDIAFAIGSCFIGWIMLNYFFALAVIVIGTVGWLREIVNKSRVCNCFGVLTGLFEPIQNYARAALVFSGLCMLFVTETRFFAQTQLSNDILFGGLAGLAIVLLVAVYFFAKSVASNKPSRKLEVSNLSIPEIQLDHHTRLGISADGRVVSLGDVVQTNEPIVLLLSSLSCGQCMLVKKELKSFLQEFSSPTYVIFENEVDKEIGSHRVLFDSVSHFRKLISVIGVPSLVVIDPVTMRVAKPIAFGLDAIKLGVIQLLLEAQQRKNPSSNAIR